ncbi:MAG: chemotaxis protein CheC [Candidatus Omnitrophica bacterium]|nr:chemotaxis protein CheC [Candidatus Omnitrophota bacterium]MBU1925607.1 chemotaxis protein CheC [Candidatus Omnitrophota bacterium]MBU2064052.1 chemotaxis protein CheC [Candidatus Omnitrophota bacterium]
MSMQDEIGILKEVGSIAAAHGGIALSEILKKKILLCVPQTEVISHKSLGTKIDLETVGVAVYSKVLSGIKNGRVIFLLDEKNAFRLNDISYKIRAEDKRSGVLTEIGMSLIKEIGSMVTSAYVTALGMMFKRVILTSPPTLISGTIREILNITVFSGTDTADTEGFILLVEVKFEEPEEKINGTFYLVLTPQAADEIVEICRRVLELLQ